MDPRRRFSNRVEDYLQYRPDYPVGSVNLIIEQFDLNQDSEVADIGSGTGKFTQLFNNRVKTIYGIEPNNEMREASKIFLSDQKNYVPVEGDAENTSLAENTIDAVVCAQAFHWIDKKKAKEEFTRILKKEKNVAVLFNNRKIDNPFLMEYEELLKKYANDYNEVSQTNLTKDDYDKFFRSYDKTVLPNRQIFDFESLCGRATSSSYCPLPGEKNYEPLFKGLELAFNRFQSEGKIIFELDTEIYTGTI